MQERNMAEMVRDQDPLTLPPGATVQDACVAMYQRRVGAVPIVDHGKLVGIFTGRDAVHALAVGLDPQRTLLGQAMTPNPCCLGAEGQAIEALRLMNDGGFRHLPVVQDGKLLGIVSRYDFRAQEHGRLNEETGFFETMR